MIHTVERQNAWTIDRMNDKTKEVYNVRMMNERTIQWMLKWTADRTIDQQTEQMIEQLIEF